MKKLNLLSLAVATALVGCSGDDGNNGADGANSLINQTLLAVGHSECANGGVQIDSGLDSDGNGELAGSEITSTQYVCQPTLTSLASESIATTVNNPWFNQAKDDVAQAQSNMSERVTESGKAKNVILFVGDGMGISTITAARIRAGQQLGKLGEEHQLSFDKMPYSGFSKTYNVDAQTPDSAGTMTALMTGVKTDKGVLSLSSQVERGDCSTVAGNELVTALELAELAGMSTGVVSTARITHATPAATYAKSPDRNWEDISDIKDESAAQNCEDIASQIINFEANLEQRFSGVDVDGLEVAMGGGRRHFLPKDEAYNTPDAASAIEGDRTDGRDLPSEWQAKYPNGRYVIDQAGFDAIDPATTERVLGLFNESHMQFEASRDQDLAGEPSLSQMTAKALDILDNNDKGYFLTVESGRIDHAHHGGNAYNALGDAIEFAKAVEWAMDNTDPEETLILVTADHSHVFTIAGYPKRGNPILGKVVGIGKTEPTLAKDGKPYTTLGYTNGPGAVHDTFNEAGERIDISDIDTQHMSYYQQALVPLSSETHAGEDVGVYAQGPGAHLVTGTNEQNYLFHVMEYAADLVKRAELAVK